MTATPPHRAFSEGTSALALHWRPTPARVPAPAGGHLRLATSAHPDAPDRWARRFAHAAMEVGLGVRPATQLLRWTTPEVQDQLARRAALALRTRRTEAPRWVRVGTIRIDRPHREACEVAAVVAEPERVRAMAFRMEICPSGWRVSVLEVG